MKILHVLKRQALSKTEDEVVDDDEHHRTDKNPGFKRPASLKLHERIKWQEPYRQIGGAKICDPYIYGKRLIWGKLRWHTLKTGLQDS